MFDFYPGLPQMLMLLNMHMTSVLFLVRLNNIALTTLQKQVGCLNHRVIALVADKLHGETVVI